MCLHQAFLFSLIFCCQSIGIGGKRNLGIDDHTSAFWESDDDIRTIVLSLFIFRILLNEEFLIFTKSAVLQDGFQNHLSPVALHLAVAFQCPGQIGGIGANLLGLLLQVQYSLLLFLLEEFHRCLEGVLQFLLVHLVLGLALLHRFLEISKLFLDRFQEFIHLQTVVFLQSRLLGSQLLSRHLLLFYRHSLHFLLQALEFLCPLLVAFRPEFCRIQPLVLHLRFQGLSLSSMRLFQGLNLRSMMQITLFDVSLQHLSLRYKLRFLFSRLFSFHQLAHEESDGKS